MVQAVSAVVLEVKGAGRLQNACSVERVRVMTCVLA